MLQIKPLVRTLKLVLLLVAGGLMADEVTGLQPASAGEPILTISGAIDAPGGKKQFDLEALEALEQASFKTKTPWTDAPTMFEGVTGRALMKAVGAHGTTVHAVALNDYATDIPLGDFLELGLVVASKVDGKRISVREKGPLWVIYPFDSKSSLQDEIYYNRSIWQLVSIEVR
jgi:hypothetical protein